MKNLAALCVATLTLTACGSIKPVRMNTADGSSRYYMDYGNDKSACIKKANEICPAGYVVSNETSHSEWSAGAWRGGSEMKYGLEITCK